MNNEATLYFRDDINPDSGRRLLALLMAEGMKSVSTLHLLINSCGGSVPIALGLARLLAGLDCRVITYNLAQCDSSALLLYVAGNTRICSPNATFMAHQPTLHLNGSYTLDELKAEYRQLQEDHIGIVDWLSAHTPISKESWKNYTNCQSYLFTSQEALDNGLATAISEPGIAMSNFQMV